MAARDIRSLPKLEGTVHVNMALIIKFMANYFFNPGQFPQIPVRDDACCDTFLFAQGPTKGLGKIQFHDYNLAYNSVDLPNVNIFKDQIQALKDMLMQASPEKDQAKNMDFLLYLGEMFTLVAYGQLIIEKYNQKDTGALENFDTDLLEQIFDFMVRDFGEFALKLYAKPDTTEAQMAFCQKMIQKPVTDKNRFDRVFSTRVMGLRDTYEMNP
jgi:acyl-CoA dehydrogenase